MDDRPQVKRGRKPALKSLLRETYASERLEQVRKANTLAFLQQAEYLVGEMPTSETPIELVANIRHEPQLAAMVRHNKQLLESSYGNYFLLCTHLEILDLAAQCFGYILMPELTLQGLNDLLDSAIAAAGCTNSVAGIKLALNLANGEITIKIFKVTPRLDLITGLQRYVQIAMHMPCPRLVIDCVFTFPSLYTMFSTTESSKATLAPERRSAAFARLSAQSDSEILGDEPQSPIDVLLVNSLGMLLGTPTDSIAVLRRGIWLTPALLDGARSDAMRTELLKMNIVHEGSIEAHRLRQGEEVMVFSSLVGITRGTIALDVPELALRAHKLKAPGKANIPLKTMYKRMHLSAQAKYDAQQSIERLYPLPQRGRTLPGTGRFSLKPPR